MERALKLRPLASLILVNGACQLFENAEHVLAGHEEKAEQFAAARRKKFPKAPPWRLHACCMPARTSQYQTTYPSVTDWWPYETGQAAGSAGKAVKLSRLLGYDEAVLVGCPMNGGGYAEGETDGITQSMNCARIGNDGPARGYPDSRTNGKTWLSNQELRMIKGYRTHFAELAKTIFKEGVYSMSGFTRECVGEPPQE
jgi:hypothetical protein